MSDYTEYQEQEMSVDQLNHSYVRARAYELALETLKSGVRSDISVLALAKEISEFLFDRGLEK